MFNKFNQIYLLFLHKERIICDGEVYERDCHWTICWTDRFALKMNILITGANGQLGNEIRIIANNSKNRIPNTNPTAAGNHITPPCRSAISRLGISSDHTDAATMTPEAKPKRSLCKERAMDPRTRKTIAAPRTVPKKGRRRIGGMLLSVESWELNV